MRGLLLSLSLVASAAVSVLAASEPELKIDTTLAVECDRKTRSGDNIEVHYKGTLASNGNKFDASYDRGKPFGFQIGAGRVIKGWEQGLLDMCIGEKRTLTVPPELGYGNRNVGPIPAGSTLIFETELMGIAGVPKPESIVTKPTSSASAAPEETPTKIAERVADKVAEKVSGAAEVVGTMLADTDDVQDHKEL
ncbi:hypothetical protein F5X96DRAFT_658372 [Biscogniauxia mediterranea]|nr:hypothetical protein F5X96DRAFT_658372 [Biscogniauxia mediterranea]